MNKIRNITVAAIVLALLAVFCFGSTKSETPAAPEDLPALAQVLTADAEQTPPEDSEFVRVSDYIPDIQVQLKYATADNITGTAVYDFTDAWLRYGAVRKLMQAADALREQGYTLKIWDAYRPVSAQFALWEVCPNAAYIANPTKGYSDHSRGGCVDLTLADQNGSDCPMPTGFDVFSPLADRDYSDVPVEAAANARLLETAMTDAGFAPYSAEWWHFADSTDWPVEQDFNPVATMEQEVTITVSAVGDCTLATGYGFGYAHSFEERIKKENYDYSYCFAGVQSILAADDLTIANAENVFTTRNTRVDKTAQGKDAYWFKSDPAYAAIYAAGSVEAVNVANNHSHDYGEEGYQDTLAALDAAGITGFGYGTVAFSEVKGYSIAMIGINVLGALEEGRSDEDVEAELRETMDTAKDADLIIVSFHWGIERTKEPSAKQRTLAHMAIDFGADLVLGHHSHTVQEVELYRGRPIAYSLGNFVFGGHHRPARTSMILSTTFILNSRGLLRTESEVIDAYCYGTDSSYNTYQPVLR